METKNKFNSLSEVTKFYAKQASDLKYQHAIALLDLLTDEEYLKVWEDNKEIMDPISEEGGDTYLHDDLVLDTIICIFSKVLCEREESDKMETLLAETLSKINKLDIEGLRKVNNFLNTCED